MFFGLRKILNDCSVAQETVGATLRMKTAFPKLQQALSPKEIEWDNITLRHIYTEVPQVIYFHIFYHSRRDNLKPSAVFRNILGESSWQILANRTFHLNSEWKLVILFY